MGIAQEMAKEQASARRSAWNKYIGLLRANESTPQAIKEMKAVLVELSKSAADVADDEAALTHSDALTKQIEATRGIVKREEAALDAPEIYEAETEKWKADIARQADEREARLEELQSAAAKISRQHEEARGLIRELNALKASNAELLADVKAYCYTDLN